jgi:group I intron endonuclease
LGIIYKHTSPSGKSYIGQSINSLKERLKSHISSAKSGKKSRFNDAVRKYGIENFISEIIEEVDNQLLNEREIYWIDFYDTYHNGYNQTLGGDSSGYRLNDAAKESMSKGTKHYWDSMSEDKREKHRKACSDSTKKQWKKRTKEEIISVSRAISEANKGRIEPEWKKEKHRVRMTGAGNSKAKKINIYDENNNLKYECNGNFKKVCIENNLPHNALRKSHNSKGLPIIQTNRSLLMAKEKGWTNFIGWYALEIN